MALPMAVAEQTSERARKLRLPSPLLLLLAVTFLLVWQDQCKSGIKPATAKLVKSWLDYALGGGQEVAPDLQYAPLPDPIRKKAQAKVDALQCNGSAIGGSS